jgi:hypothetical protein
VRGFAILDLRLPILRIDRKSQIANRKSKIPKVGPPASDVPVEMFRVKTSKANNGFSKALVFRLMHSATEERGFSYEFCRQCFGILQTPDPDRISIRGLFCKRLPQYGAGG